MKMKIQLTIFLLVFFTVFTLRAQENTSPLQNNKSMGFTVAGGIPYYALRGGKRYYPLIFSGEYYLPFYQTSSLFNAGVILAPQFVYIPGENSNYEAGVNVIFSLNFKLSNRSFIAGQIGSGPHWISIDTRQQAKGFIFSDNFLICYRQRIHTEKSISFITFAGLRHISNAGLAEPNVGIDNVLIGLGLSWGL